MNLLPRLSEIKISLEKNTSNIISSFFFFLFFFFFYYYSFDIIELLNNEYIKGMG